MKLATHPSEQQEQVIKILREDILRHSGPELSFKGNANINAGWCLHIYKYKFYFYFLFYFFIYSKGFILFLFLSLGVYIYIYIYM